MNWAPNVWAQIKNITCDELVSALERDGWERDTVRGGVYVYRNAAKNKRVTVHYHPKKTYRSPNLLKGIINEIGWNEADLRRLKLIK